MLILREFIRFARFRACVRAAAAGFAYISEGNKQRRRRRCIRNFMGPRSNLFSLRPSAAHSNPVSRTLVRRRKEREIMRARDERRKHFQGGPTDGRPSSQPVWLPANRRYTHSRWCAPLYVSDTRYKQGLGKTL